MAAPHHHRISPGVQGMPNALLNQDVNVFICPKNQLQMAHSSGLVSVQSEWQKETLSASLLTERGSQHVAVAKGTGESPAWPASKHELKGKCYITSGFGSSKTAIGVL